MKDTALYALVTGASSGIGWHIAMELAARGYSILAVSNQAERLRELKLEIERQYTVQVQTLNCDLSEAGAAEDIYDFCRQKELHPEVLVNNAGMMIYGDVTGVEVERVRAILQLHMNTPVMLCRLFGARMQEQRKGYILNISSISAVMPYPSISLYGPTKNFLRKFTRAFRYEMKRNGIHVTCLLPGATATALYDLKNINVPLARRFGIIKYPGEVAKTGVNALFKNRAIRIPGLLNKLTVCLFPLLPVFLISFIYGRVKRRSSKSGNS